MKLVGSSGNVNQEAAGLPNVFSFPTGNRITTLHAAARSGSLGNPHPADHFPRLETSGESILKVIELSESDCRVFMALLSTLSDAEASKLVQELLS